MTTDLERLHAVLEDPHPGPRSGKTTAVCHLIAGAIEMGETRIHVLISHLNDRQHFFRVLQEVLWEHELSSNFGESTITVWTSRPCLVRLYFEGFTIPGDAFPMFDARRHSGVSQSITRESAVKPKPMAVGNQNDIVVRINHTTPEDYPIEFVQQIEKEIDKALSPLGFSRSKTGKLTDAVEMTYFQFGVATGE